MNISIIDDHELFGESLKGLLENADPSYKITVHTSAKHFFETAYRTDEHDIIISDILMKDMTGVELLEEIRKDQTKKVKFILLSSIADIYTLKNALRKGANGYLTKDATKEELLDAIATVSAGKQYMNKTLQDKLLKSMFAEEQIIYQLSPREKEVLNRICKGKMPKEISAEMELSVHTIQQYIKNIMKKFNVNRTTELVVFAIQKGIYNPAD